MYLPKISSEYPFKLPALLSVLLFLLPFIVSAQVFEEKGDVYFRKGYNVQLSKPIYDTVTSVDPANGDIVMKVRVMDPHPISINDVKVYYNDAATPVLPDTGKPALEEYVLEGLKKHIEALSLPDGVLKLLVYNVIINGAGRIAYFRYDGISYKANDGRKINTKILEKIRPEFISLMQNAPLMKPATMNGKNVVAVLNTSFYDYKVSVRNKVVSYKISK